MTISKQKILEQVYTAKNHDVLMETYDCWAKDYDEDTVDKFGYVAPRLSAETLNRFMPKSNATILDAGCGTGLVGEALITLGYKQIDALDYSKEMLCQAKGKDIYNELYHADLNKPLAFDDNSYDAVICVGTFTYAHVGPQAFDELIRITRPGGYICLTVREGAFEDHDYPRHMAKLEEKNAWKLLELRETPYLAKEGINCQVCTFTVS